MTTHERIEVNPQVMMGKPVIRGTRIPVEILLRKLGEGAGEADLLEAYPQLTRDDIHAAIRYAAASLAHEEGVFVGDPALDARGLADPCGFWPTKTATPAPCTPFGRGFKP